jgi:hypothetical protein
VLSEIEAIIENELKGTNIGEQEKKYIYTTNNVDSLKYRVNLGFSKQQLDVTAGMFEGVEKVIESI